MYATREGLKSHILCDTRCSFERNIMYDPWLEGEDQPEDIWDPPFSPPERSRIQPLLNQVYPKPDEQVASKDDQ